MPTRDTQLYGCPIVSDEFAAINFLNEDCCPRLPKTKKYNKSSVLFFRCVLIKQVVELFKVPLNKGFLIVITCHVVQLGEKQVSNW